MQITKIGHSCLLVEDKKRILIDPGNFVFMDGSVRPEQFRDIDIVLLTHEHADHTFPEALKVIVKNNSPKVVCNAGVGTVLDANRIPWMSRTTGVRMIECRHGTLPDPLPTPQNTGFVIGKLFHPGDSLWPGEDIHSEILALPIVAPWASMKEVLDWARQMRPHMIIPIHDGFPDYLDFARGFVRRVWPEAPLQGLDGKPINV
ncbi:MAG: MBL fold metallo-hydrolase [Candidatus Aenigmarchaeota archaeon]|nr:MBL fold metallo-hydrolase [Candidatus Aenigmarchaeota archaeon]